MNPLTRVELAGVVRLWCTTVAMRYFNRMSTPVLGGLSIESSLVKRVNPEFPEAGGQ